MGRNERPHTDAHIRILLKILNHPAFIALDYSAKALYVDLRSKLRSSNNGNISAALKDLRHRGWRSPTTLAKALRQLEAVGLIAKTRKTIGVDKGSTLCNLYRFTDLPVNRRPDLGIESVRATHDYLRVDSLAMAVRLIRQASASTKKSTLQNLEPSATDTGVKPATRGSRKGRSTPETVATADRAIGDSLNPINHLEHDRPLPSAVPLGLQNLYTLCNLPVCTESELSEDVLVGNGGLKAALVTSAQKQA